MLSHSKGDNDSIIVNQNTSSIGIKQAFISNEKHNYLVNELNITQEDNELSDIDLNDNLKTKIWIENCSSPLSNLQIGDSRVVGGLVPLGIICLVVIIGNMMVMYAVKMTKKLRGATYLFIVSLGKIKTKDPITSMGKDCKEIKRNTSDKLIMFPLF